MCEFVSWIVVKKNRRKYVFHLDDDELFSERTREILQDSRDNDFLGHQAIREVYGLSAREGKDGERRDFWNTRRLPRELREKLKDFETFRRYFGKMIRTYAQMDDLQYIADNAPQNKAWRGLKQFAADLLNDQLVRKQFAADLLNDQLIRKSATQILEINCRYNFSSEGLIKANLFRGYVDPDITNEHFPSESSVAKKREAVLLCLYKKATDKEVSEVMKRFKLRDGLLQELLSLALDYPDLQREFPIVARGSDWRNNLNGDHKVAYLYGWGGDRSLHLSRRVGEWCGYCRFLVFRELLQNNCDRLPSRREGGVFTEQLRKTSEFFELEKIQNLALEMEGEKSVRMEEGINVVC